MKKTIFLALCFFITQSLPAQITGVKDIIKDPAVSRRCKTLIAARNEKIKTHQKLNALLQRSKKLLKRARPTQTTAKSRVELTTTEIKNNIRLTKLRIKTMEEDIVRKGCPGISL